MFQLLKADPHSLPEYTFNTHQQVKAPQGGAATGLQQREWGGGCYNQRLQLHPIHSSASVFSAGEHVGPRPLTAFN